MSNIKWTEQLKISKICRFFINFYFINIFGVLVFYKYRTDVFKNPLKICRHSL